MVAVLVAAWLVVTGSRVAWASAFLVLASALVAVVLYRYVPVPQLGPIPSMYEPIWFPEKTVSAVAEGSGALLAAVAFAVTARRTPMRRMNSRHADRDRTTMTSQGRTVSIRRSGPSDHERGSVER